MSKQEPEVTVQAGLASASAEQGPQRQEPEGEED